MADGSAAFGSPTSRMCLQRTHQLGIFRQAITHFFRPLPGERRPAGRGVPIPAVRRRSELVIGPTPGSAATTAGELVPWPPRALRLEHATRDPIPRLVLMLEKVRERADDFDVLHFHVDYLHFPLFRSRSARVLTTLHSRLDLPDHSEFYLRFPEIELTLIGKNQSYLEFLHDPQH